MSVRALEPSSLTAGVMGRLYEVIARCHAEANPEEPCRPREDVEAFLRHAPASDPREYWVAESAGECVGFARLSMIRESPTGDIELLVHPDHRRRALGTELLGSVRKRALERGARKLIGHHATEAGSLFAAAVGAVDTHRMVRSLLRLPLRLEPAPVDGYTLHSWVGAAPVQLLNSYARVREAVSDAPHEEHAVWDAAFVRDLEAAVERRGRDIRVTVALDPEGEVVASTELRVSRTPGAIAGTEDTAVVAEHRRRGLARWIKAESLLQLQRDRPDVSTVTTTNAEDNNAIRSLNHALGFLPVAVYTSCVLQISG